jgi:hypothetical protein
VTKVLCKGGPYYWIKEPLTELERRVRAHHRLRTLFGSTAVRKAFTTAANRPAIGKSAA